MKKRTWYWALPAVAGVALVVVAIMSWATGPIAHAQTATPTVEPTATANPACQLSVDKTADESSVPLNGTATFTIEVTNDGNGDCVDPQIADVIPDNTDCEDAAVASSSDITDINIDGCDASGTVTWDSDDNLNDEDTIVLTLELSFESDVDEGDRITNEACVTSSSDVDGECDDARVTAGEEATATPQATATGTPIVPPPITPPPPVPTSGALPTISPPATGTSSEGNSMPLAATLGVIGVALLTVSGVVFVKRTR